MTDACLLDADRAAAARARIYGMELDALLLAADAMDLTFIPTSAVRLIVDRMLDRRDPAPFDPPQSLDAWRATRPNNGGNAA